MSTLQINQTFKIGNKTIGPNEPVFVIAEAGINHDGDMKQAEALIRAAKTSGVDAIKFQTYVTEKRVAKDNPVFDILKKCEISYENQKQLFDYAKDQGVLCFSTPFDPESADFLTEINSPALKIASFDIVNLELLRHCAGKGLPMIISRGMASEAEVETAVDLVGAVNPNFSLLHCISCYPNEDKNANLAVIETLRKKYDCPIGFSDHTLGIRVPVLSVAVGAKVIEKHFTLDRAAAGPDHALSADPESMKQMVAQIREVEEIMGSPEIKMLDQEKPATMFRRPSA